MNRLAVDIVQRDGSAVYHLQVQGKKAMEINDADVAELVDARDLKSLDGNVVWVRVPPPAPEIFYKQNQYITLVLSGHFVALL